MADSETTRDPAKGATFIAGVEAALRIAQGTADRLKDCQSRGAYTIGCIEALETLVETVRAEFLPAQQGPAP